MSSPYSPNNVTQLTGNYIAANSITSTAIVSGAGLTSDHVYISQEEYEELKADSTLLYALIDEGVEEWEGYDRAILNI